MTPSVSRFRGSAALVLLWLAAGCGGDSGTTPPGPTVATVTLTSSPVSFATLGRTAQFAAVAKDAGGTPVSVSLTWTSSNNAVATVSSAGLVTAVGNGTATINAGSGSVVSNPGVQVTVQQVASVLVLSPTTIAFGAIAASRQVTATLQDSGGASMAAPLVTWIGAGSGKTSVTSTGIVAALGVTAFPDTVRASVATATGTVANSVLVTVTQVPVTVTVTATSAGPDTLKTTGSTRQYAAAVKDSNANAIAGATVSWSSTVLLAATVGPTTGLATAVADGSTSITATAGTASGSKTLVVRRFAKTLTVTPTVAAIALNAGTQGLTGTAADSSATALPIAWASRNLTIATVNPAAGATTTVTAVGNGSVYIIVTAGTRSDSAQITTSNQLSLPTALSVSVGDDFFRSQRNSTQNPAVDTIAVNGTVTWVWGGLLNHSVESTGSPTFLSSTTKASGNYALQFTAVGTYTYDCAVHGSSMTGTIVVR
jgi:plastocyanin